MSHEYKAHEIPKGAKFAKPNAKCYRDFENAKGNLAICLLKDGKWAGRILGFWSKSSSWTSIIFLHGDDTSYRTGKAGGYGYDKLSASIADSARQMVEDNGKFHHIGDSVYKWEARPETLEMLKKIGSLGGVGVDSIISVLEENGFQAIRIW